MKLIPVQGPRREPQPGVEEAGQGRQGLGGLGDALHEPVVAGQAGELAPPTPQVPAHVPQVEVLERAVVRLVEQHQRVHQDGHHLAQVQPAPAVAPPAPGRRGQQVLAEQRLKSHGELVQVVEQCDHVHRRFPRW